LSKTFTDKQKLRLPDEGYLLEYYEGIPGVTGFCLRNGEIRYNNPRNYGFGWHYLTWTCCPTRKALTRKSTEFPVLYEHFETHEEMIAKHPELEANFPKAQNDF
jgi:hypothetical protein